MPPVCDFDLRRTIHKMPTTAAAINTSATMTPATIPPTIVSLLVSDADDSVSANVVDDGAAVVVDDDDNDKDDSGDGSDDDDDDDGDDVGVGHVRTLLSSGRHAIIAAMHRDCATEIQ